MVNHELPAWFYRVTAAARLIALSKGPPPALGQVPPLRPIAVGDNLRRAVTKSVVRAQKEVLRDHFWPEQAALGVSGGSHFLATWARTVLAPPVGIFRTSAN